MKQTIENFAPEEMLAKEAVWYEIDDFAAEVKAGRIGEGIGYYARDDKISSVRVKPEEYEEGYVQTGLHERMNNGKYVVWLPKKEG